MNEQHHQERCRARPTDSVRASHESRSRDPRFQQLLHSARAGDQDAIGDLWREFQFDFDREGGRCDLD